MNTNTQSFTITNDSNLLQVRVREVTQNTNDDLTQGNTATLSRSHITITQPLQTQQTLPRKYDPPPLPSQYSPHTTPYISPQQGSSNPTGTTTVETQPEVQFQTTTLTRQPTVQASSYTPAQNTQTQNIQPGLTNNTLNSNTLPNSITSRNLSRPPLQIITNIRLSYSLTSANPK